MLLTLAISGYRSIRDLAVPVGRLTVVTGRNGSGKSSFYRALRLLADVAQGRAIAALAAEGGLPSTLWAGPEAPGRAMRAGRVPVQGTRRKGPVSLRLGFASEDYGYAIDLGLPVIGASSAFGLDPEIKAEAVWIGEALARRNLIAARAGPVVTALDRGGARRVMASALQPFDSMMTHAADPRELAELALIRDRMRDWRFYDHFRADREAPARRPQVGTRTPVLASDGADLAAAIQTIREIGDAAGFDGGIEHARTIGEPDVGIVVRRTDAQDLLERHAAQAALPSQIDEWLEPRAAFAREPGLLALMEPDRGDEIADAGEAGDLAGRPAPAPRRFLEADAAQNPAAVHHRHAKAAERAVAQQLVLQRARRRRHEAGVVDRDGAALADVPVEPGDHGDRDLLQLRHLRRMRSAAPIVGVAEAGLVTVVFVHPGAVGEDAAARAFENRNTGVSERLPRKHPRRLRDYRHKRSRRGGFRIENLDSRLDGFDDVCGDGALGHVSRKLPAPEPPRQEPNPSIRRTGLLVRRSRLAFRRGTRHSAREVSPKPGGGDGAAGRAGHHACGRSDSGPRACFARLFEGRFWRGKPAGTG